MTWRAIVPYIWETAGRIVGAALSVSPPPPADLPAFTVGKLVLTGADVRALGSVAWRLVEGTATTEDTETVADTIIEAALSAAGGPVAALAAPAAEALAGLIIAGIAEGTIRPGAPGEGQTKDTPRSGRRA